MIVVDASIALAWCFADEADAYADRVLDMVAREGACAPAHWTAEVANGLRSAERRGRTDADGVARAGRLLGNLGVEVVPVELSAAMIALEVARQEELSAYDAIYLDLAWFRRLPLATIDQAVARACRHRGIGLVG
jgi:predicted nucleic acid-binding protein